MRRILGVVVIACAGLMVTAAGGSAATPGSGAFSGFNGGVSCHWVRTSTVTTVRCWGLKRPGSNNAVSTGDTSGRIARTQWHPPVGKAMVFGHKYKLGNGVTCSYRWRHVTDTSKVKSVQCATSVGGPLIFANPGGVSANITP
jgi:hypothetical protein